MKYAAASVAYAPPRANQNDPGSPACAERTNSRGALGNSNRGANVTGGQAFRHWWGSRSRSPFKSFSSRGDLVDFTETGFVRASSRTVAIQIPAPRRWRASNQLKRAQYRGSETAYKSPRTRSPRSRVRRGDVSQSEKRERVESCVSPSFESGRRVRLTSRLPIRAPDDCVAFQAIIPG
jgi:hypothetical protein